MTKGKTVKKIVQKSAGDVNIAVIGAGYWGTNLIRNFFYTDGVKLRFVCDSDKKKLEHISRHYPGVATTGRLNDILGNKKINAVIIATPVHTHFSIALRALRAGKHVLVEKPMASSSAECERLIAEAKKRNLILMVDHTFLYAGPIRKIKELIEKKELGSLYYFDSERVNLGLIQPDINVIWDLAPHDIAIMNHFFVGARPVKVFATGTKHVHKRLHEIAHVTVYFDTGIAGHIHVSWISPVKIRKTVIGGSKKMILYDDIDPSEKVKVYDKGVTLTHPVGERSSGDVVIPVYRTGDVLVPKLDVEEPLRREARHFVAALQGKEKPLVTGEDGLEVVRILEACDKSIKTGNVVHLP